MPVELSEVEEVSAGRGEEFPTAGVAMEEATAEAMVEAVSGAATALEVSEVFPSYSPLLLRRSIRQSPRPSSCLPRSRPEAGVEGEVNRGPATGVIKNKFGRGKNGLRETRKFEFNRFNFI